MTHLREGCFRSGCGPAPLLQGATRARLGGDAARCSVLRRLATLNLRSPRAEGGLAGLRKRSGEESASRKSSSWESQTAGRTGNSGAATVAADVDIDLGPMEFLRIFPRPFEILFIPGRLRLGGAEEDPFS